MDLKNKYEKTLENWAKSIQLSAEEDMTKALFISVLETGEQSEQFLNWFLAFVGLTLSLIIGNIDGCSKIVPIENLKITILCLIVSGILGLISKILIHNTKTSMKALEKVEQLAMNVLDKFDADKKDLENSSSLGGRIKIPTTNFDIYNSLKDFIEPYNFLEKKLIIRSFEKSKKNPLTTLKRQIVILRWYSYFFILQILITLGGLIIIIHSLFN